MPQSGKTGSVNTQLKEKIYHGSFWTIVGFGSSKALQLLSNLILTRLLFPEAFGLMALVNVFIAGMYMLSDVGIKPAIIQMDKAEDANFLNTAWTLQVIRGFGLWLIVCLIAYPAALIYGEPQLFGLLCFTGFSCVIGGFKSINVALADRNLQIKRSIMLQLVSQVISVSSMITLAFWIDSVWALAIGTLLGAFGGIIAGYIILSGHKHSFKLERESALQLFHFGKWVFWSTLFTFIGGQGVRAVEGGFVSMKVLGIIAVAGTLAMALNELVAQFQSKIIFPVLAIINRETPDRFSAILGKMRLKVLVLIIPLFSVVSLCSNFIVSTLYDDRYALAGPFLAILAIHGAIQTLPMLYQKALMAKGDTRKHFNVVVVTAIFRLTGMFLGIYFYGVFGMLVGTMFGSLLAYGYVAVVAAKNGWLVLKSDLTALFVIGVLAVVSFHLNVKGWLNAFAV